jgi:hypothetical protein
MKRNEIERIKEQQLFNRDLQIDEAKKVKHLKSTNLNQIEVLFNNLSKIISKI